MISVFPCTEKEFVFANPARRTGHGVCDFGAVHDYLRGCAFLFKPIEEIVSCRIVIIGYSDVENDIGGMHSFDDDEGVLGFLV